MYTESALAMISIFEKSSHCRFCETVSVAQNKRLKVVELCIKTVTLLQLSVDPSLIMYREFVQLNFIQLYSHCDGLEIAFDRPLL